MARATRSKSAVAKHIRRSSSRSNGKTSDLRAIERARILIVASDPQTMSDMQDPQVSSLHEIEIALNSDVAKTILAERHMDVLAMDTAGATSDDVDKLKSVRDEFPKIPIIAIGDRNTKVIEKRVKKAGANYYITRPLESRAVTKTIGRALVRAAKRA